MLSTTHSRYSGSLRCWYWCHLLGAHFPTCFEPCKLPLRTLPFGSTMATLQAKNTFKPFTQSQPLRRGVAVACPRTTVRCKSSPQDQGKPTTTTPEQPEKQPAQPPAAPAPTESKPLILQQGQGTAIITGAVSIIFGVAYLALVFLMDWRGGEMLPPPPEAYGP